MGAGPAIDATEYGGLSWESFCDELGYEDEEIYTEYATALKNGKKPRITVAVGDDGELIKKLYIDD